MIANGVVMLRNQIHDVAGLQIVGLDDLWGDRFDPVLAFKRYDPARAAIALSHNPDTVDLPGWGGFQGWILSGHTHGGQCKPPFLPPPVLPVRNRRYTCGEFELSGGRTLYINPRRWPHGSREVQRPARSDRVRATERAATSYHVNKSLGVQEFRSQDERFTNGPSRLLNS